MRRNAKALIVKKRLDNDAHKKEIKTALKFVYEDGRGVKSTAVERLLGEKSLVPVSVRFST